MQSQNLHSHSVIDFESFLFSFVRSLAAEAFLLAQKSLLWLLLIGSLPSHSITSMDVIRKDQRFPVAELFKVEEPVEENKDASETEENDYSDDDGDDHDEDEDDDDSEEDSDGEEDDSDDNDSDINEDGSDDDDSGDEDDGEDDDDSDDSGSDDEDDDEDEDEQPQPPSKKKK